MLFAAVMGCSKGIDQPQAEGRVYGHVFLGESSATIPKVTVSLGDLSYKTVTNGEFEFRGLEPGKYEIIAEKGGYVTVSDTILVEGAIQHDLRLFRTDSLD